MSRGREINDHSREASSARPTDGSGVDRDHRTFDSRKEATNDRGEALSIGRSGGESADDRRRSPERPRPSGVLELPLDARGREEVVDRGRTYLLRNSDVETLREIGRFRTIAEDDLARFHYQGRESAMHYDLRSLAEQGLVARRRHPVRRGETLAIVTLTEQGRRLLGGSARESDAPTQQYYAGFVKPAEIAHDAAIYRMYQAEAEEIERAGGRVERVVLDYELKRRVYSPLAAARDASPENYASLQQQVAQDNALEVVDGKIPLPDLRIEFQRADGESAHVDLELATEHYRASQLAAKARAGFKLYGLASSRAGAPVRDEREITAEILAL